MNVPDGGDGRHRARRPTSARDSAPPPPANDVGLDAREERLLDAAMRASVPLLRRALADVIGAARPRPPKAPRHGAREGDLDAPVDEVTRELARRLLARHGGRR